MGAQRVTGGNRATIEITDDQGYVTEAYPTRYSATQCVEMFTREGWDLVVTGNKTVIMSNGPTMRVKITRLGKG